MKSLLTSYGFFIPWEVLGHFFPVNYSTCMLLAIGACALVFHITHTMSGRNSLKKKKGTLLSIIWLQNNFLSCVSALKMDKFVLKVKPKKNPCSITQQERAKQNPGKFHTDNNLLFCSTCNLVVDHHRKSVLDKHLSAVSHIKQMDESSSKRAKQQTLKTSFKCKLHLMKRKWKSAMSG